jgi:acetyltransferase-like isoleucine patch superfamily enzyme
VVILAGPPGGGRLTHQKKNPDFELDVGEVRIGDHTHVAPYCVLSGIGGIDIGSHCGVASHSAVYSFSHNYRNAGDPDDGRQFAFTPRARPDQQAMILGPVVIRDYCAVGLNSVLLPGTTLERGTWLACGSVAAGRYGPQAVVSGDVTSVVKDVSELRIVE